MDAIRSFKPILVSGGEAAAPGRGHHQHCQTLSSHSCSRCAVNSALLPQVMGTAITGQLIATFPYDAPGKLEAGWVFWWLALAFFVAFFVMIVCR